MTSALEFTYLYNDFSLRINGNIMNRAVRVKTAVKDKIKRVYESKEVVVNNENTTTEPVQVTEKESLIDLSQEKLLDLNNILNWLEEQKNVSYTVNRAVLFTQPLVAKINRVSDKWFNGMPRVEKKEETSTDIPSVDMINHLGGEVVPGNWNSVVNEVGENIPLSLEPTLEPVPTIEPVLESVPEVAFEPQIESVPSTDIPQVNIEVSNIETQVDAPETKTEVETKDLPQVEVPNVNIEIPTVSENTDIYRFPSFDFNMESVAPTVTNEVVNEPEVSNASFDFVKEPNNIDVDTKEEYVSEPTAISSDDTSFAFVTPSFEAAVPTESVETKEETIASGNVITTKEVKPTNTEKEDAIGELLNKEFTPNPANNFVPKFVDNRPAEVKIDEVLGRDKVVEMPSLETKEEPVVTVKEEKPVVTQGQIIARLRRVNNEMAEKDATIKSLTAKNDSLKDEVALNKDKVAEYEVKVTDLSAKNTELASQNERLASKLEEVETNSRTTISKLEAKVEEVTHARTDEIESLRRQIEELKSKHAEEISSMREKHSAEIKLVNETKDKQIQAIYSTISEALGETPIEEDYTRGMAA